MKNTSKNKTGTETKNAQAALADINARIAELEGEKVALAQPLKDRYAELRGELLRLEIQVKELDPNFKPEPLKVRPQTKIADILTAHGAPMTAEEIIKEVAGLFTNWKVKNTLKKKSQGAKALFAVSNGKYSLRPQA
jgi:uncharacterized protein (UPF0335 family)